jgi:hypothetical protein
MEVTEADLNELGPAFSLTRDLNIDGWWEAHPQFDPTAITSLRCFRDLESLSLTDWHLGELSPEQLSSCFRHFGETVVHFKLEGTASSEPLICLTSMFPRLRVLEISIKAGGTGRLFGEELPTTGSFQGYLYLWQLSEERHDLLVFLSSTPRGSIRSASTVA